MSDIKIKSQIHDLVDTIDSDLLLHALYDVLKSSQSSKPGQMWSALTEEQKSQILLSFDESEHEENLIDAKKVFPHL